MMIVKRLAVLLMLLMLAGCASTLECDPVLTTSAAFPGEAGVRVAAVPFGGPTEAGRIVADRVAAEIMTIPGVTMVDTVIVQKIMERYGWTAEGVLAERDVRLVNEAGVDALLIGTVEQFAERKGDYNAPVSTVVYSARVVDIATGEVLLSLAVNADENNYKPAALAQELAREAVEEFLEERGWDD